MDVNTWHVHASTVSLLRGARRRPTAISLSGGVLAQHRGDGTRHELFRSEDVLRAGVVETWDLDDTVHETVLDIDPRDAPLVWIETSSDTFVFPVGHWWPGGTRLLTRRALASSGFDRLLAQLSRGRPVQRPWTGGRAPITVVDNDAGHSRRHLLDRAQASAAFLAAAPTVEGILLIAFSPFPVTHGTWSALVIAWTAAVSAVALAAAALVPTPSWFRRAPTSSTWAMRTLTIDRSGLALAADGSSLTVRDVDGIELRFRTGGEGPSALSHWHIHEGRRPLLRVWDSTGTPRLQVILPAEAEAPGLATAVGRLLTSAGLAESRRREGGRWPALLPARKELDAWSRALLGSRSPWQVPSLAGSCALLLAGGLFCVTPLVALAADGPLAVPAAAVGCVALGTAVAAVATAALRAPLGHLLARVRWAWATRAADGGRRPWT